MALRNGIEKHLGYVKRIRYSFKINNFLNSILYVESKGTQNNNVYEFF
jgi:hypothetical protein